MPTRERVGCWLTCVALWPAVAGAQSVTDIELIEMILRDGAQARAIRSSADVSRHEQAARTVFPNPAAAYTREGAGMTEFFQLEQTLPVFGSRAALARAGRAATASAEAARDTALMELRTDAQTMVARLLAEQEKLGASDVTVREVSRIIELLRVREREGEGSRFDRLRAEQELAEVQQISLEAAASAADARASIAAALRAGATLARVTGTLYTAKPLPAVETLNARATAAHPRLRALQLASERFRLEAEAARRARGPIPALIGGMKRAEAPEGYDVGGLFGISVNIPLFDTGRRDAARWIAERDRADAERTLAAQSIRARVAAAAEVLALRQEAVHAADSAAPGDELSRIAEVAYTEGDVGILELLDAYRTAARARIRAIEMRLAARLAQIALERAVGETIWP